MAQRRKKSRIFGLETLYRLISDVSFVFVLLGSYSFIRSCFLSKNSAIRQIYSVFTEMDEEFFDTKTKIPKAQ